jgi:hypothetical protein
MEWGHRAKADQAAKARWNSTFVLLGANIDAVDVGGWMGIDAATSITHDVSDFAVTRGTTRVTCDMVSGVRAVRAADFTAENRDVAMGRSSQR